MSAVLIKGGLVYDGSGNEPIKEDVLVRGKRILKRGSFSKNRAEKVIDATGAMVTPGFVDVNSSADHYLEIFDDDFGRKDLKDGITTVIGGNCGVSFAPIANRSLFSLRNWADISGLNVDWHDFSGFFKHLEKQGLNINFGSLVGHSTIRKALLGDKMRDLTENEVRTAKRMLIEAFRDGVLGFSTGLEFADTKFTPVHEIEELVNVVAEEKRVYAAHLRDYGPFIEKSVEEAIRIAKKTGVNLEISHFMPMIGEARNYLSLKAKIEDEGAKMRINFDCNSFSYVATPLYQLLPEKMKKEGFEKMIEYLNSEHLEKEIIHYLKKFNGENIHIGEMPPHLHFLYGKSLRDYAVNNELSPAESLFKLMKSSGLRGVLLKESVERDLIEDFVFSQSSFISSGEIKERGAFLNFLKLAEKIGFSTEKAIAKLTTLPAEKYKLKWRGKIREDYYADLLVIKDGLVKDAIVNGGVLIEEGRFKKSRSGKVLRYQT